MIIARVPQPVHAWRPIVRPLLLLLVWDVGVTALYFNNATHFEGLEIQYTLYGSAIALFIGFMVNAAYARWWEARTLWGQIVNSSRSFARQVATLIEEPGTWEGLRAEIIRGQIAYVHILRTALRGQELPPEAEQFLGAAALDRVRRATNKPAAVLYELDSLCSEARRCAMVEEFARIQLAATLATLTDAQGGLERIKNTPLPVQYRFLPRVFARVFCVILPFAVVEELGLLTPIGSGLVGLMLLLAVQIGDELAEPFNDTVFDVPMTALCRTIEIDLVELIGENPPAPVQPDGAVLW